MEPLEECFQPTPTTGAVMTHTLTASLLGLQQEVCTSVLTIHAEKACKKIQHEDQSLIAMNIYSLSLSSPNARAPVAPQKEYLSGIDWLNL